MPWLTGLPVSLLSALLCCAVMLAAGCATQLPHTPPRGMAARVEPPALRVGTRWTYRARDGYTGLARGTYSETLTAAPPGEWIVEAVREGATPERHRYDRTWNWLEKPMTNLGSFRFDPPYPAMPFPLEAGKRWRARVSATDPRTGRVNTVLVIGQIVGWERIRVPAGEFDTLKIHRTVYAGNAQFFRGEENIEEYDWYSPRLGQTVRRSRSSYHTDTSMACEPDFFTASCAVRGDWTVYELAVGAPRPARAARYTMAARTRQATRG